MSDGRQLPDLLDQAHQRQAPSPPALGIGGRGLSHGWGAGLDSIGSRRLPPAAVSAVRLIDGRRLMPLPGHEATLGCIPHLAHTRGAVRTNATGVRAFTTTSLAAVSDATTAPPA